MDFVSILDAVWSSVNISNLVKNVLATVRKKVDRRLKETVPPGALAPPAALQTITRNHNPHMCLCVCSVAGRSHNYCGIYVFMLTC